MKLEAQLQFLEKGSCRLDWIKEWYGRGKYTSTSHEL